MGFSGTPATLVRWYSRQAKGRYVAKTRTRAKNRGFVSRIVGSIGGTGAWPVRLLRWLLFLLALGVIAAIAVVALLYVLIDVPDPNADFKTETTKVYYSDGKSQLGSFAVQDRDSLPYDEIPDVMKQAAVAAEDRSFWENRGIDLKGIIRAARNNATSGEITSGGSTITQQYVKILYLNQERSYQRKVKEAILSLKIHNQLSKEEILGGYLNTIYYGNGAYGVEVASQTYFGKPAAKLTVPQAAFLATVVNSPTYYDPYVEGAEQRILPRYNYVLEGMYKQGSIDSAQFTEYKDNLPKFRDKKTNERFRGPKGYVLDVVQQQLRAQGFSESEIVGGGFKVVTSISKRDQADAVKAVKDVRPDDIPEVNNALVSIQPGTGAVRALYGGKDYVKSQLNWATLRTQPGSTFKAFAVVAALENGYSLQTRLNGNAPLKIGGDEIENQGDSGGKSYGYISLEKATQFSVNTAFADLTDQMDDGPNKILDAAREAGIPEATIKDIDPVLGVALGYAPVAPIDMANAYATLAADGKRADWYVIERVDDANGSQVYKHNGTAVQAIDKDVAADTLAALQTVVRSGTGTKARTVCTTVGKTGTATAGSGDDARVSSSWFVGATPKLATAVMYNRGQNGNGELEGYLNPFYGGTYPALTFKAYMDQAVDPDDCGTFPKRANIRAKEGTTTRDSDEGSKKKKDKKDDDSKKTSTPEPTQPQPTTVAPTVPPTTAPSTEPPTTAPPTASPSTAPPAP